MTEPYDSIAREAYRRLIGSGPLTNARLREYFNACFQSIIDQRGAYQCWTCVSCLRAGRGAPPSLCPGCGSRFVYEVGAFQVRAPIVGKAFSHAFGHLMQAYYRLPLTATPGNTETHDFEVTGEVVIEAKGSPDSVVNPDGTVTHLGRPGLERSDTRKKAFDNARQYRRRMPSGTFFIVSNAIPADLVGYRNSDVTAIFDVTKVDRLQAMMTEIEDQIDLPALRARRAM